MIFFPFSWWLLIQHTISTTFNSQKMYFNGMHFLQSSSVQPLMYSTVLPLSITHLKQTMAGVGAMVNLRMVTTIVTSTTYKQMVRVLLDHDHNRHLVFVNKTNPCCLLTQKSWFHSHGIHWMGSPTSINLRGSWTCLTILIAKGSIYNLMWSSMTRLW
jgi:hypothetical protein